MLDLAEFCARIGGGLDSFVHVSTAYVAGTHPEPFGESDLDRGQEFRNAYERSKFEAELVVARAGRVAAGPGAAAEHRRRRLAHRLDLVLQRRLRAAEGVRPRRLPGAAGPALLAGRHRPGRLRRRRRSSPSPAARTRPSTSPPAPGRATVGEIVELASAESGRAAPRVVHPELYRRARSTRFWSAPAASAAAGRFAAARSTSPTSRSRAASRPRRTRVALAPKGIEAPPLRAYFDRLMAFARAADWGKRPAPPPPGRGAIEEPRTCRRRRRARRMPPRVPAPRGR